MRRFLDKKDTYSTGNMRKHVKTCWGANVLAAADIAKDLEEVRTKIIKDVQQNGSITVAFERKKIVTYSHRRMSHCPTYSGRIPEIPGGAHWNPLESDRKSVV